MKRFLIVIIALCFLMAGGSLGLAADLSFGVKGGVTMANYIGSDSSSSTDSKLGLSVGVFGEFSLVEMIAIQPEALFNVKGTKYDFLGSTVKENLSYIDVPVLVKFYPPLPLPVKINAFAGPYAGIAVAAKAKVDGSKTDIMDTLKTFDFGLVFGGGADVNNFTVDARYALGLAKIAESGADLKNGVFSVLVGYRLK